MDILKVREMCPGVFQMSETFGAYRASGYLVVGEHRACMIDTMYGRQDLGAAVRQVTDRPVTVVNTHGHPDHIEGNIYFDHALLHPADHALARGHAEEPEFQDFCRTNGFVMPPFGRIQEGDTLDLGGKHLEVYDLPGHTHGGIVILDREDRILFTGDGISHHLWMQLPCSVSLQALVRNLDRILFLEREADRILHGHAGGFDDISLMRCVRNGAEEILEGHTEQDVPYFYFDGTEEALQHPFVCLSGRQYSRESHEICYRREKLYSGKG